MNIDDTPFRKGSSRPRNYLAIGENLEFRFDYRDMF